MHVGFKKEEEEEGGGGGGGEGGGMGVVCGRSLTMDRKSDYLCYL